MSNMIEISNKTKSKINIKLVKGVAQKFLKYYNIKRRLAAVPPLARSGSDHANVNKVELSIAFVGDKVMRRLNREYRGIDKITDVLAFSGEDEFLGEVIINYAQVKRQAKKFGNNIQQELIFILVHGLLHLLGYDDKAEKGRLEMERMGEEFIKVIGNL